MSRIVFVAIFALVPSIALAAPPASCANKFVGTWTYAGGTTVVAANGVAYPKCAMCVATQNWTCQGNTYFFSNSGPPGQFSATLSADGRQLIGGGVVATRVGGAANSAPAPAKKDRAANKNSASQKQANADARSPTAAGSPNCSTITGTGSGASSAPCPASKKTVGSPSSQRQPASTGIVNQPVPSGTRAAESLRTLVPEFSRLIDGVDRQLSNLAPPMASISPAPTTNPAPVTGVQRPPSVSVHEGPVSSTSSAEPSSPATADRDLQAEEDEDYAIICRDTTVTNGIRSLRHDFDTAVTGGRRGLTFFVRKLKLQWATLKKCIKEPLVKGIIERLEADPIIQDVP